MGCVTRRFRAFGDFLYALPCGSPVDLGATPVRRSHASPYAPEGDARAAFRSSAAGRRIGSPGASNSCAGVHAAHRPLLPEGLRQGVGRQPLPAGVVGAAGVDGAVDQVPPGAQRRDEGFAVFGRSGAVVQAEAEVDDGPGALAPFPGEPARRGRPDENPAEAFGPGETRVRRCRPAEPLAGDDGPVRSVGQPVVRWCRTGWPGKRGRDRPPRCAAAGPVRPDPWRRTTRRRPSTAPSRPSPSPAWPRPAGARAPGPGPAPSSRPRRSCRPGR